MSCDRMGRPAAEAPIERRTYDAAWLMAEHPPRLHNANKQVVFNIARPAGSKVDGTIEYSRWPELALRARVGPISERFLTVVPGFFDYEPVADVSGTLEWHMNFADPELFGYYGGRHMAQDELQVAEHPVLAALREALLAEGLAARTIVDRHPTPVLVRGAERRVHIYTAPNAAEGRPEGIYGRRFGQASAEVVVEYEPDGRNERETFDFS